MNVDFFPPRFENPCDYTMILVRFSRHLVKHNIIPLELVREILMRMRDNFLNELEIEAMRGFNLPDSELVQEVEVKRAINRSISVKAMMNLIHTRIGDDGSVIVPQDQNVPLDLQHLPSEHSRLLNMCTFRIRYSELSPYWLKMCVPGCRFLVCSRNVYTLKHSAE